MTDCQTYPKRKVLINTSKNIEVTRLHREKGASETILDGSETRFLTGPLRNKVSDLGLSETRNSGRLRNKGRNKALSETRAEQGPLRNKGGLGGGRGVAVAQSGRRPGVVTI